MTRLRSTPRPGRDPLSQDRGEADEQVWPKDREWKARFLPAHSRKMKERLMCMSRPDRLLQPKLEREVEALLLQKAHVDGDATHARRHDAVHERAAKLCGEGAGDGDAAGHGAEEPIVAPTLSDAEPSAYSAHVLVGRLQLGPHAADVSELQR